MSAWFFEFLRLLTASFWQYGSFTKTFVVATLAVIAFMILVSRIGVMLRIPLPSRGAITVLFVSIIAFLASLAAFNVFVGPHTQAMEWGMNAKLLLTLVVLLVVTVPLMCRMQEATYAAAAVSALFSTAGTLLAVILIGTLVDAVWNSSQREHTLGFQAIELSDFFLAD